MLNKSAFVLICLGFITGGCNLNYGAQKDDKGQAESGASDSEDKEQVEKSLANDGYYLSPGTVSYRPVGRHSRMVIQLLNDLDHPVVNGTLEVRRLSDSKYQRKAKEVVVTAKNPSSNVFTILIARGQGYDIKASSNSGESGWETIAFDEARAVDVQFPIRVYQEDSIDDCEIDECDDGYEDGLDDSDPSGGPQLKYCDVGSGNSEEDMVNITAILKEQLTGVEKKSIEKILAEGLTLVRCKSSYPEVLLFFEAKTDDELKSQSLTVKNGDTVFQDYWYR